MYRSSGAGACLLLVALAMRVKLTWDWRMLPMAACFATMNYWFMASMSRTTAANAILLQYTAPLWMFLASVLLLGEKVHRRSLAAVVVGMAGIVVLLVGAAGPSGGLQDGVAFGLLSGVTFAAVTIFLRVLRDHPPLWLSSWNQLTSGLAAAAWFLFLNPRFASDGGAAEAAAVWPPPSAGKLAVLALFATLQLALPYVLYGWGLKVVSPQEAGILALLEPLLNPVWTYLAAGEVPSRWTMAGGLILLAALTWQLAGPAKPQSEEKRAGDGRP